MVRPITTDEKFLSQPSDPATEADRDIAQDLLDTLAAHSDGCVGMAANIIGELKRIIVVTMGDRNVVMYNPRIIKHIGRYETVEGCVSLQGMRQCTRYRDIDVEYQDFNFIKKREHYSDWIAQIIQHEVDHCNGIVI